MNALTIASIAVTGREVCSPVQKENFMTEKRILDLLRSGFLGEEALDAETSLFQSGRLDSMTMLTLLSIVENLFDVSILNGSFDIRQVDTVRQLAGVVERLQISRPEGGAQPGRDRLVP